MSALTVEQFGRYQTSKTRRTFNVGSSVKFNPTAKRIKRINEDVILKRNDARILLLEPTIGKFNLGTQVDVGEKLFSQYINVIKTYATQGTDSLDFWHCGPKLSDYKLLVDDYDVAAIEEIHMQSASKYGW
jgi:hypothetical protein